MLQLVLRSARNLCETAMNALKKYLYPNCHIPGVTGYKYNPTIPACQESKFCLKIFGGNP